MRAIAYGQYLSVVVSILFHILLEPYFLTSSLSSLSLLGPVVFPRLGCWIPAVRASMLLNVEGSSTASSAESVCLVMALAEAGCTLRCSDVSPCSSPLVCSK